MGIYTAKYIEALLSAYERDVDGYLVVSEDGAIKLGATFRRLLIPTLHRWGIGMQKGGDFIFPVGNVDPCTTYEAGAGMEDLIGGMFVLYVNQEGHELLYRLHPDLSDALWTRVKVDPNIPYANRPALIDYMEDILLPRGSEYLWISKGEGNELVTGPATILKSDGTQAEWDTITFPSYGPVTQEYLDDVAHIVKIYPGMFLDTLPVYRSIED